MKKLIITLKEDGTSKLDVIGFDGPVTLTIGIEETPAAHCLGKQDTRDYVSEKDCLSIALSELITEQPVWAKSLDSLEDKYGCRLPIFPVMFYKFKGTFEEWINRYSELPSSQQEKL